MRKIPIVRVLVPYIAGACGTLHRIVELQEVPVSALLLFMIAPLLLLWVSSLLMYRRESRSSAAIKGAVCLPLFLLFMAIGAASGILSGPSDPGLPVDQWVVVRGTVQGSPQVEGGSASFDLRLQMLWSGDTLCRSPTLLKAYLPEPVNPGPRAGETWQFCGRLAPIQNSGNPGEPDYRAIMGRKNCWYRFYVGTGPDGRGSSRSVDGGRRRFDPARLRDRMSDRWSGDPEEISLLKAVCLGDRSSLTDEMRQAYAEAGGMHLLAVSGLHVGLIWWVLQHMTRWLTLILRRGRMPAGILEVGLLWFYAFLTGLSSSVCRSVTMFSFFTASRMMGVRHHPLNAILVSAFVLVLVNPARILDVGFQLSYAAITGIVTLHPLSRKLHLKNRILRWLWEAIVVSLAAQFCTAPLVIYYFQQLPLYALLTSLLAVPMLSLLIAVFVCSVLLSPLGSLEGIFNFVLVKLAGLMNRSMDHISSIPGAVLHDLHLEPVALGTWLLVVLLCLVALHHRTRVPGYLLLFLISLMLTRSSLSDWKLRHSSSLVIFHLRGASMVSLRTGSRADHYCWFADSTSLESMKRCRDACWNRRALASPLHIMDRGTGETGRVSACFRLREGVWLLGGPHCRGLVLTGNLHPVPWTCLQEEGCYEHVHPDFILLAGEPAAGSLPEPVRMDEAVLVVDGSNRSWYRERIEAEEALAYLTNRSGAYMKRW